MENTEKIFSDIISAETGEMVVSAEQIVGGVNSIVYKLLTDRDIKYIGKKYLAREGDNRSRLTTEFYGLSFLWSNGVRNIPRPVCSNTDFGIGIYSFIDGRKLCPKDITSADINMAADFLSRMHSLINADGADGQPVASEACFSVKAYIECIEERLGNFKAISEKSEPCKALKNYLDNDFSIFFEEVREFIDIKSSQLNVNLESELRRDEKTLSPSDFGFHNAIKSEKGILYFIDFEYYGWDDPAKMISDFYLQPGVPVPHIYREVFFEEIIRRFGASSGLERRLPFVYLLLGLKWCLIMLNIFFKPINSEGYNKAICLQQLEKAKNKLWEIRIAFEKKEFPVSLN